MQATYKVHFKYYFLGFFQGLFLGPWIFNIFINDLIGFIKCLPLLYNFADDNTITALEKDITLLKETLPNEGEIEIQWLNDNFMIVKPCKFRQ